MLSLQRIQVRIAFGRHRAVQLNWPNVLRGSFGAALRELFCSFRENNCSDCIVGSGCVYGYMFETPIPRGSEVLPKHPAAPHPFLFEPPSFAAQHSDGTVEFDMVLVGRAVSYLPFVIAGLQKMGANGLGKNREPYTLLEVRHGNSVLFSPDLSGGVRPLASSDFSFSPGPSRTGDFTLRFETPTSIQVDGRVSKDPEFPAVFSTLLRRLFLLRYFHGDGVIRPLTHDYNSAIGSVKVLDRNLQWRESARYSARQQREVPQSGFTGEMVCSGDIGALEPALRVGEFVHVGKHTAFGMGKISVFQVN